MSKADSRKVVVAALAGNLAIAACKFVAAHYSDSTSTLAEAVHSLADTANQALLLVGMRLAVRPANARFAFGRASESYFWPLIVALMLFTGGGVFAIFEGLHGLVGLSGGVIARGPNRTWSYAVLGISILFEAISLRVAFREFRVLAKGKPWRRALLETRDPTIPLVLAEDATALIGLSIALVAVAISGVTGQPIWDQLGSVLIGLLLCFVAWTLARLSHGLLIGESATREDQQQLVRIIQNTEDVLGVTQLLTMHLGPEEVIVAMKIAFRADMRVDQVEDVTNRIERNIRAELPQMKKIFIEADSYGDGRGVFDSGERRGKHHARA